MDFSYYPGCSLDSTASEYNDSVRAVFAALDVGLHELEDWNCCGASSAHSLNRNLSLALPARNLAIAQEAGRDVVMPCAACFNRHKVADHELRTSEERRAVIEEIVDFEFSGAVAVRPVLDIVGNAVGLERLKARVTRPLTGLKLVSYYGCLLVRPPEVTQFENPEHPTLMNEILAAIGADVRPWSYATDCCGGGPGPDPVRRGCAAGESPGGAGAGGGGRGHRHQLPLVPVEPGDATEWRRAKSIYFLLYRIGRPGFWAGPGQVLVGQTFD